MSNNYKNLQESLDSDLLPEGHFLAPRIGRTIALFDFSDLFITNIVYRVEPLGVEWDTSADMWIEEAIKILQQCCNGLTLNTSHARSR